MGRPHTPRTSIERAGARVARKLRTQLAADVQQARDDSGISIRRLARAAGVSHATLSALERGTHDPSIEVLARVGTALGMDLSVRLYPNTGRLVRDHIQAAMIEALLRVFDERWQPSPEMAVYRPVRGVIDLVLDTSAEPLVATETQSELRRLEQQLRWSQTKADAGAAARARAKSHLLLLRSTRATRTVLAAFKQTVRAAYPARSEAAYAALTGDHAWPGAAVLWCDVAQGRAHIRVQPPRGISIGR